MRRKTLPLMLLALICFLCCSRDLKERPTKQLKQGETSEKSHPHVDSRFLAAFGPEYLSAMEAGDRVRMSQLVRENLKEIREWIKGQISMSDYLIKGAQGRPIMSWGDKQLTARDLSRILESVAREYEIATDDSELLHQVEQWQTKHQEDLVLEPIPAPSWDVQTLLEEYKHALDRNDEAGLEDLVKCNQGSQDVLKILDLAAYLQFLRPQHKATSQGVLGDQLALLSYRGAIYDPSFKPRDWLSVSESLVTIFNRCHGTGRDIVADHREFRENQMEVPSAQEPKSADEAAILKIMEELVSQGEFSDERELSEKLVEAVRREFGGEHPTTLKVMAAVGSRLFELAAYAKARRVCEEAIEVSLRVWGPEHAQTLTVMNNLAVVLDAQGHLAEARKLQEDSLSASRRTLGPEHPGTLAAMNNLAGILKNQGYYSKARELLDEALSVRRRVLGSEHPDTLTAMNNLAAIRKDEGYFAAARTLQEDALSASRRVLGPEHRNTLRSMNNLAGILYEQGYFARGRVLEEEALSITRGVLGPEHPDTLTAMNNLAQTLKAQGELAAARALEEEVLLVRRRVLGPEHLLSLVSMNNLGSTLEAQGDFAGAHELEEKALSVRLRVLGPEHPVTLISINNLGLNLKSQGELERATKLQEEALSIHHRVLGSEHPDTLTAISNLVSTLRAQGDLERAQKLQKEVLSVRSRVLNPEHPDTLSAMNGLADIFYEQGDLARSQRLYEDIIEIRARLHGPDHQPSTTAEAATLNALGRVHRDSQRFEEARAFFFRALEALEAQADRADVTENVKSLFRAQFRTAYRDAIAVSLSLGRRGEAFHTVERFRAKGLLTLLAERRLVSSQIPPELEATRRQIAARYDAINRELDQLDPESDRKKFTALRNEQGELRRRREVVSAEIGSAGVKGQQWHPKPLTLEAIRDTLDPGTLMLSYSVGQEGIDLFIVANKERLEVHHLQIKRTILWRQVRTFLRQIREDDRSQASEARTQLGQWLYEKLLRPAAERIEASDRLLIIPDGPLHHLPFAALVREAAAPRRGWQYLAEWKPLHTVLSATVHAELQKRRPLEKLGEHSRSWRLVAFGDPAYPGTECESNRRAEVPNAVRFAVSRDLSKGLECLPHSKREVTEIGRLFKKNEARTYLREAATEEQAKTELSRAQIVHFAVHSVLDPLTPFDSYLALTLPESAKQTLDDGYKQSGNGDEKRDNGILQAWEIYQGVQLDADLVVLSACETALGPDRGGDGLISLTRAFRVAGARTVAASLWRVDDESTAELMIRFYRHLRAGKPKDEALQAAQVELIRGPIEIETDEGTRVERDFTSPYNWAAFQLIGDWK